MKIPIYYNDGSGGTLIEKTISKEGTYNAASDDADGYSSVIVEITKDKVSYLLYDKLANDSITLKENFFNFDEIILYTRVYVGGGYGNANAIKTAKYYPSTLSDGNSIGCYGIKRSYIWYQISSQGNSLSFKMSGGSLVLYKIIGVKWR